jgi:hypothetical protein
MSVTYSIKIGTPYEAKRIINVEDVLKQLPDNTNKEISPKDVRDAFLSTWANSPFKITSPNSSTTEYIGIDSGNPANRDIKQKMFFGKRQLSGQDIMNDTLLRSDTDIYFYNTRLDTASQSTKISILSGTDSKLFQYAPFIESKSNGTRSDLIIRNPSTYSNINIESTTGRVSINGISFPTIDENKIDSADGKVLRYQGTFPNGYLKWDNTNIDNLNVGSSTTETKLYGGTVSLNGFELEFSDSRMVPKKIGGVEAGFKFNQYSSTKTKWPLSEVLRKLLYTYVPPELKISVYNKATGKPYFERGTLVTIGITFSVTVYSIGLFTNNTINPTNGCVITQNDKTLVNVIQPTSTNPIINIKPGDNTTKELTHTQGSSTTNKTYHLHVSDNNSIVSQLPVGFSHSATASMFVINPIYYGFTNSVVTTPIQMTTAFSKFNKLIDPTPGTGSSIYVDYKGDGYLYFCYPKNSINSLGNTILFGTPSTISDGQIYSFKYHDSNYPSLSIFTHSNITDNSLGEYSLWRTKDTVSFIDFNKIEFKF